MISEFFILLFSCFIPGYFISFFIFRKEDVSFIELLVFGFALSVALIGSIFHFTGLFFELNPIQVIAAQAFLILLSLVFRGNEIMEFHKNVHFSFKPLDLAEKIFIIYILLQLSSAFYYSVFFPIEGGDPVLYHIPYSKLFFDEKKIVSGEGVLEPTNSYPHGIHLLNTWFYFLNGSFTEFYPKIMSPIFSLILGILVYACALRFFDRKTALLSMVIFYSMPIIIAHSEIAYINIPEVFYDSLGLYLLYRGFSENKGKFYFASGIIGGFSMLIKISGTIFFMTAAVLFIAFLKRVNLRNFLAFCIGAVILLSPLWYLNSLLTYGSILGPYFSVTGEHRLFQENTMIFPLLYFFDFEVDANAGHGPFLLTLGLVGAFILYNSKKEDLKKFLLLWIISAIIFTTIFAPSGRFIMLAALPISLLCSMAFFYLLKENNGLFKHLTVLLLILLILPGLFLGIVSFKAANINKGAGLSIRLLFPPPSEKGFLRELNGPLMDGCDFIQANTPSDAKVLSTTAALYFINRTTYIPSQMNLSMEKEKNLEILASKKIKYILLSEITEYPPDIAKIVNSFDLNDSDKFELLLDMDKIKVYKVK